MQGEGNVAPSNFQAVRQRESKRPLDNAEYVLGKREAWGKGKMRLSINLYCICKGDHYHRM